MILRKLRPAPLFAFIVMFSHTLTYAGPSFYCRRSPEITPVYSALSIQGCSTEIAPTGACIYPSVGCVKINANIKHAAQFKFKKSFENLSSDEKETLIQVLTPSLWLQQNAIVSPATLIEAEQKRHAALVNGVTDPKDRQALLNETDSIDLLPTTLMCKAKPTLKAKDAECPSPSACLEDVYFDVKPAIIRAPDDENLVKDVKTPTGEIILPAKVFNAGEAF